MRKIAVAVVVALLAAGAHAEQFLTAEEEAKLEPVPGVDGVLRHSPSGKMARDYPKGLIGSVTFFFAEKSKSKDIDADEMKQISDAMKQALVTVAGKNWQIVQQPGPDVVQINVAITDIELKNKKRGLLGYTPIGLVTTTARNLAGKRLTLGNAQLQGEIIDSISGDVISIFALEKIGEFDDKKGMSWEDVRLAFIDAATRAIGQQQGR